jgi:hypothetical protein
MKVGERIQYACGHWLVAGTFGIKDDTVKDVPNKQCGECRRRLQDAAPNLLAALEETNDGILASFESAAHHWADPDVLLTIQENRERIREVIREAKEQS